MTSSLYSPRPRHSIVGCTACLILEDIQESAEEESRILEGWAHDLVYDVLHYHVGHYNARRANESSIGSGGA